MFAYLDPSIQRGTLIRHVAFHAEMADQLPRRLSDLLDAPGPDARSSPWEAFVGEYSKILIQAVRTGSRSYDETMDRYAYVLGKLQADGCRRLRGFSATGRGEFTTWLFVVARRLCVDHHRHRFGRPKKASDSQEGTHPEWAARHRLANLISEELDLDRFPDLVNPDPETEAWLAERRQALVAALACLEARDQLLITLRFVDELSVREITGVMSFRSPFQVYRRLNKILSGLQSRLQGQGISEL